MLDEFFLLAFGLEAMCTPNFSGLVLPINAFRHLNNLKKILLQKLIKRKEVGNWFFPWSFYACFLIIKSASTAPIMTITMMIAMPMYSTVDSLAMPVSGVAVGASVACAPVA